MRLAIIVLLTATGCARQQPLNPMVPPETQYSAAGTLAAAGGLAGVMAGASMMENNHSRTTQKAGIAAASGGLALMGAALVEAVQVNKEREKFITLYNAFLRNYYGSAPPGGELRLVAPPPPDVPVEIPVEESPLNGKDAKP